MKKLNVVISILFIGLIAGQVFTWGYRYNIGYDDGYDIGYSAGWLDGEELGYNSGYLDGLDEGHSAGFDDGYFVGFSEGNSTGFEFGYIKGVEDGVGRGFNIRDPTYFEALQFIQTDQTDKHEYTENYTCFNFAADFKSNAFKAGYRCGFVYIEFSDGAHAIVCFNTTDKGIIFIEPQDDNIVEVKMGIHYWVDNGYLCSFNDTIIYYAVIW